MLRKRQESIEYHDTESQTEPAPKRSDISLKKIKEILTKCHEETDEKLEELSKKCVRKNEQQKA